MSITAVLIYVLPSVVIAIVLHEMMHAWVSYLLGDETAKEQGRITLNPLPHINIYFTILMPLVLALLGGPLIGAAQPVPINTHNLRWGEYGMALVALAGPLTNLALAIIGGALYAVIGGLGFWEHFLPIFVAFNVGFFVFNMLPLPPLDGSRVFYLFMPDSVRYFMDVMERMGLLFAILILILILPFISPVLREISTYFLNILL